MAATASNGGKRETPPAPAEESAKPTRSSPRAVKKEESRTSGAPADTAKSPTQSAPKRPGTDRRALLEAERDRLQAELERAKARVRASLEESDLKSGDEDDLADAADAIYDRELGVAVAEDLRERLRDIDETLKRLDDSGVPKCEMCNQRISKERLRWVPSATRCASCQDLVEGLRRPAKARNLLAEPENNE